jgi:arginine deiminase
VGVKDVGVMIGKMVWETREREVLLQSFQIEK